MKKYYLIKHEGVEGVYYIITDLVICDHSLTNTNIYGRGNVVYITYEYSIYTKGDNIYVSNEKEILFTSDDLQEVHDFLNLERL